MLLISESYDFRKEQNLLVGISVLMVVVHHMVVQASGGNDKKYVGSMHFNGYWVLINIQPKGYQNTF